MPYKSQAQRKWAHATKQKFADEWDKKTKGKKLPKRASKGK